MYTIEQLKLHITTNLGPVGYTRRMWEIVEAAEEGRMDVSRAVERLNYEIVAATARYIADHAEALSHAPHTPNEDPKSSSDSTCPYGWVHDALAVLERSPREYTLPV